MIISRDNHLEESIGLQNILDAVAAAVAHEPIESMILVGSMARGESTVRALCDSFDLWSDVDLYIVSQPGSAVNESRLWAEYEQIANSLAMPNPFFHIDFTVLRSNRLHTLPRRISTYEARENGVILAGRDVRSDMPLVNVDTLDYGNTRQLILIRLSEMLFYTPSSIVSNSAARYEQLIFGYIQARNALDILTILLPHEGVLLPTYRARNQYLRTNYQRLAAPVYMGLRFPDFVEQALVGKLSLEFGGDIVQLYEDTVNGYRSLLRYLLRNEHSEITSDILAALEKTDVDFNSAERPMRQRLNDFKLAARSRILNKPALHPLNNRKMMLAFLLEMHSALLAHLQGSVEAVRFLKSAREILISLSVEPIPCLDNDFVKGWLTMRRCFLDIYTSFLPGKKSRRAYYSSLLQKRYDNIEM